MKESNCCSVSVFIFYQILVKLVSRKYVYTLWSWWWRHTSRKSYGNCLVIFTLFIVTKRLFGGTEISTNYLQISLCFAVDRWSCLFLIAIFYYYYIIIIIIIIIIIACYKVLILTKLCSRTITCSELWNKIERSSYIVHNCQTDLNWSHYLFLHV